MREHLAVSHGPQGLVILHSTGSVLPTKDRLHTKGVTAVPKGQRINCIAHSHPFSQPMCTPWLSLRATSFLPHFYTVTFGRNLSLFVLKSPGMTVAMACHFWKLKPMGYHNSHVSHLLHGGDDNPTYILHALSGIFTFSWRFIKGSHWVCMSHHYISCNPHLFSNDFLS